MRRLRALFTLAACGLALATAAGAADAPVTVRQVLWDANQRPLYQQCADAFHAANPDVRVRLQQVGWDDYWSALSTGFVSGTAPDVFVNHLTRHPEFVANGVLMDLSPWIARDRLTPDQWYEPGLLEMWRTEQRQFGLPLDWDTIALALNLDALRDAGLSLDEMRRLTWNPDDGGSFGRAIERLTVDEQGRHAGEPGFDRRRVRRYGYQNPSAGGMMGQTEWSHFAVSAGWRFQQRPWDGALRYDDPAFVRTIDWLAALPARGVSAPRDTIGKLGADAFFLAGRVAMVPVGSWMVGHYARHARFPYAWLPLPVGPSGQRATMLNSVALSIWSGTPRAEAAWRWVRYAGSRECQARIAPAGVVYPAVRGLGQIAADAQGRLGPSTQAFVDAARGLTFQPPLVPRGGEVADLMGSTLERVLAGSATASQALPDAARRVREITSTP